MKFRVTVLGAGFGGLELATLLSEALGERLDLKLIECNDLGSTDRQEQFSLIFAGPPNALLPQRIYPVQHDAMGELSLFIVPISRDSEHFYYEAVFNYFKEANG